MATVGDMQTVTVWVGRVTEMRTPRLSGRTKGILKERMVVAGGGGTVGEVWI